MKGRFITSLELKHFSSEFNWILNRCRRGLKSECHWERQRLCSFLLLPSPHGYLMFMFTTTDSSLNPEQTIKARKRASTALY